MILATIETKNYEFKVISDDEIKANDLLKSAWESHCLITGANISFNDLDVNYLNIELNNVIKF